MYMYNNVNTCNNTKSFLQKKQNNKNKNKKGAKKQAKSFFDMKTLHADFRPQVVRSSHQQNQEVHEKEV